jgi:hypothetical protein
MHPPDGTVPDHRDSRRRLQGKDAAAQGPTALFAVALVADGASGLDRI